MSTFYPHYASALAVGLSNPPGPFHVMLNGNSNALTVNSNAYVGVGKSNAAFALDVLGDLNFTGTLRSNSVAYVGSQWTTVNTSNVYYSNASGPGCVGIGKSNPAFALDVVGGVNCAGAISVGGSNIVAQTVVGKLFAGAITQSVYVIQTNGVLNACGYNNYGQIGNNSTTSVNAPLNISSFGSLSGKNIVAIAPANLNTIALDNTGTVHAWGFNSVGQLGNNSTTSVSLPINVSGYGSLLGKTITKIASGDNHTLALDSTGAVHAWGWNCVGQLGTNTITNSPALPANIMSFGSLVGKTVVTVGCGGQQSLAIDSTGALHAWGKNYYGNLGNNSTTDSSIPINVSSYGSISGKTIVAIAGGTTYTVVLDSTGAVHTWGTGTNGQLGNNTTSQTNIPINISSFGSLSGKTITAICSGNSHVIALDTTGAVHIWGAGANGQLGNNATTDSTVPINIMSFGSLVGKTIKAIAGGYTHTVVLDSTGAVHTWGDNSYGQLGNTTTTQQNVPISIMSYGALANLPGAPVFATAALATMTTPGVVQVGSGLSVSSGVISAAPSAIFCIMGSANIAAGGVLFSAGVTGLVQTGNLTFNTSGTYQGQISINAAGVYMFGISMSFQGNQNQSALMWYNSSNSTTTCVGGSAVSVSSGNLWSSPVAIVNASAGDRIYVVNAGNAGLVGGTFTSSTGGYAIPNITLWARG